VHSSDQVRSRTRVHLHLELWACINRRVDMGVVTHNACWYRRCMAVVIAFVASAACAGRPCCRAVPQVPLLVRALGLAGCCSVWVGVLCPVVPSPSCVTCLERWPTAVVC
jgi:hypothetical protein